MVTVLRRVDDNWYEGRLGDAAGIFPASYVEPLKPEHTDGEVITETGHLLPGDPGGVLWTASVFL